MGSNPVEVPPISFVFFFFAGWWWWGEGSKYVIILHLLKFMHILLLPFLLFHKGVINVILLKAVDHFQIVQPEDWLNNIC